MNYLYNGKELEKDLGWSFYGFRMYDPMVGRFTGVDPIADQFAFVSVYNYAENKPVSGIDLHGLQYLDFNLIFQIPIKESHSILAQRGNFSTISYHGKEYIWVGRDLNSTVWINESLSSSEQNRIQSYYHNYNPRQRRSQNECHSAGCCIDCFNGSINVLHGISEQELSNSGVPGHNQTINHSLNILKQRGLAEELGSFKPVTNAAGKPIGYSNLEETILNSANGIRGVYYFGVSLGNGFHSTALTLDLTDIDNPIYTFYDTYNQQSFSVFENLVSTFYLNYADSESTYGTADKNVNLVISKINSDESN